ncbi:FIST N-terminal domain-containing protein [Modestobacter sp. NPDC049651]|uniref:FIST signal transduction protein n=1 Tax=unclassified Modestobacter TaxID=2643866 RepID=UPI00340F4B25
MTTLLSGTGTSELPAASDAGREAAAAAVATLQGTPPALVVVFASVRYDLGELLAGIRSVTGDAPLVGSTSSGHFAGAEYGRPGSGVAVLALAGGDHRFGVGSATGLGAAPREAGAEVVRTARQAAGGEDLPYAAVLLLADGLVPGQQQMIAGAHRAAGASVPIVGGAAGDDWQLTRTSVLVGDQVLTDAVVGVWIASPRPLTVATAHGWAPVGPPQLVTRAEGDVIHEIGGRPAAEVYAGAVDVEEAARRGPVPDVAMEASSYALGVIEPDGSHLVRAIYVRPDGEISSFEPVATFSAVQLMTAERQTLLEVVDEVAASALVTGEERVLLTFNCAARQVIIGDRIEEEVARLQAAAGAATCFGFYTYGEFARSRGAGGVHNATLTALAL